jgi:phosphate-selective porin OprO/OprP
MPRGCWGCAMARNGLARSAALWLVLLRVAGALGLVMTASAQEPSAVPAPGVEATAPSAREAQLEARIRQLEALIARMPDPAHVQRLEAEVRQLSTRVKDLSARLAESETRHAAATGAGRPGAGAGAPAGAGAAAGGAAEEVVGGAAAGVQPSAPPPSPRFDMPEPIPDLPARARFGPGFEIKTTDDEFNIQFHNLTQVDGRFYQQRNQSPVADTFTIPREWFIFSGHMGKPFEYYVSFAQAFDTLNILDVFLNVNFDKRLQFRAGRFKSPFTYEFFGEPSQGLANGEWSLFFNNFGMNRDFGLMLWGQLAQDRLDYAVGIFNNVPNSLVDPTDFKDLIAYVNFAPFETQQGSILENFNIGGSVVGGGEERVPIPQMLRTTVPTTGNAALGVPFLAFNNNVVDSGFRNLWSLHTAYYYQGLSLIVEWQSGFQTYALANQLPFRTRVPIESFYVQAAYFLTGERVASRGLVKPRRPFDLRKGKWGPGAWEVAFRVNPLRLGNQVFTAGLADPNLWTNQLYTTDLGVSWYWNQYVRILFDWQHAGFGEPVLYRPGGLQKTSDLFLLRFQVWF